MLRITTSECGKAGFTLRLEGELSGPWVNELQRICAMAGADGRPCELDLAEVRYADRKGVELLIGLRARGVQLLGCTPFLTEALRAGAAPEPPSRRASSS